MTIKRHVGPAGGQHAVSAALSTRAVKEQRIDALGGAPNLLAPVPVYHLDLADAQHGAPVQNAKKVGWWYPVVGGLEPAFALVREEGGQALYSGITHGLLAKRFYKACVLADEALGGSNDDYEPRLFDVPALHLISLWLAGPSDRFVPLMEGKPPGSAPLHVVESLEGQIKDAANRRGHPAGGGDVPGSPTN